MRYRVFWAPGLLTGQPERTVANWVPYQEAVDLSSRWNAAYRELHPVRRMSDGMFGVELILPLIRRLGASDPAQPGDFLLSKVETAAKPSGLEPGVLCWRSYWAIGRVSEVDSSGRAVADDAVSGRNIPINKGTFIIPAGQFEPGSPEAILRERSALRLMFGGEFGSPQAALHALRPAMLIQSPVVEPEAAFAEIIQLTEPASGCPPRPRMQI